MLTATKNAAELLTDIRAKSEAPDDAMLRVAAGTQAADGEDPTISLGFVDEPLATDAVADAHGLGICVAAELAPQLDDAVLDVVEEQGQSRLVFVQAPPTS